MSFLKRLFGGSDAVAPATSRHDAETYEGHTIQPTPMAEGGQWRLAADLSKTVGGEVKTHRLIRADLLASEDDAAAQSVLKARKMIDEQGDRLYG